MGQTVKDHYVCSVCVANVVWNPQMCQECENLFCGKCIDAWLKSKNNCPLCSVVFAPGKIPRIAKLDLGEMEFKCEVCSQNYSYNSAIAHWTSCLGPKSKCFLECGSATEFKNPDELSYHLLNNCIKMPHNCITCWQTATREQAHDCAIGL